MFYEKLLLLLFTMCCYSLILPNNIGCPLFLFIEILPLSTLFDFYTVEHVILVDRINNRRACYN